MQIIDEKNFSKLTKVTMQYPCPTNKQLYTEAQGRLSTLLSNFTSLILQNTWCSGCKHIRISGHSFKNHSLDKNCVALLPIYVFLAFPLSSLELQLRRQRNVFLQARMNNLSPTTEPCVGYEQFSKHKRKEGICYPYINKLKQANLQMERIKVSV